MKTLKDWQIAYDYIIDGLSKKRISIDHGIDRATVSRVIRDFYQFAEFMSKRESRMKCHAFYVGLIKFGLRSMGGVGKYQQYPLLLEEVPKTPMTDPAFDLLTMLTTRPKKVKEVFEELKLSPAELPGMIDTLINRGIVLDWKNDEIAINPDFAEYARDVATKYFETVNPE